MFLLGWVGRYTLMPVHMQSMFHVKELAEWEKDDGSSYGAHRDYPPSFGLLYIVCRVISGFKNDALFCQDRLGTNKQQGN